jgi:hypothetical protein
MRMGRRWVKKERLTIPFYHTSPRTGTACIENGTENALWPCPSSVSHARTVCRRHTIGIGGSARDQRMPQIGYQGFLCLEVPFGLFDVVYLTLAQAHRVASTVVPGGEARAPVGSVAWGRP